MSGITDILELEKRAVCAAKSAGVVLREGGMLQISEYQHDIKSEADLHANEAIFSALSESRIPIVSEETNEANWGSLESGLTWVVDPLDGTVNYTKGNPLCCVSISLCEGLNPVLGVIYDFGRDIVYSGIVDKGASCNGAPMKVSETAVSSSAILGTGFPSGRSYESKELQEFVHNLSNFRKVRLLGSAALSLAWVGRGWLDAYHEKDIYFWDVAAGIAIVKAAGGSVTFRASAQDKRKFDVRAAGRSSIWEK